MVARNLHEPFVQHSGIARAGNGLSCDDLFGRLLSYTPALVEVCER
jgi:hypothetical protein